MKAYLRRLATTWEAGQTLLEYALIVGLLSVAAIMVLLALGDALGDPFEVVTEALGEVVF